MGIKDRIISDMPRLIWLIKITAPFLIKYKIFLSWIKLLNHLVFTTKREMPEVQNLRPLKEIYKLSTKAKIKFLSFADTFNINFEVKNIMYAIKVLNKFGFQAIIPSFDDNNLSRPLCCGRTYISYGQMDKAKFEIGQIVKHRYFDFQQMIKYL